MGEPVFAVTWGLIGAVVLSAVLLYLAGAVFVMSMWGGSRAGRAVGFAVVAVVVVAVVSLVCAGGGWL